MLDYLRYRCVYGLVLAGLFWGTFAYSAEPIVVNDNDRIVFLGSTFIERDVAYGCIETLFTGHFADKNLTFRNLGWSGDNVFGIARASFDSIAKGYERLIAQVKEAEPNIVILNYGQTESFGGEAKLAEFIAGYGKLLDDIKETNARFILVSPTLQENLGSPLPDPSAHNSDVRLYSKAILELAKGREIGFVDMTQLLPISNEVTSSPLTDNGLHFTEAAYWKVAPVLLSGLGMDVSGLSPEALEPLRQVILEKNRLFFNKWRPQNETYITGFRKHEQGQHVEEFPLFDPLVIEQEAKIAKLRVALGSKGNQN